MRLRVVMLGLLLAACTVGEDADYSDDAWSTAEEPDSAAALEDSSATAVPDDVVDDSADVGEPDGDFTLEPGDEPPDAAALTAAAPFRNPLGPACADPGVIHVGDTFWVACTGNGFPLFKSHDLVHWTAAGHLFTVATKPTWGDGNWWAPEVHQVGSGLVAYFTARSPGHGNKMCIGAARAATMAGPWIDLGHPLVCDSHVSLIDASMYTDAATGKHYLLYKTDGNGLSPQEKTVLYITELGPQGVGFVGARHALIHNTLAWEGDVVEAPWMIHRGAYYYLFYSGFRYCNDTYGVGVARSHSPLGPFTKRSAPILHSNSAWTGPGHNSIVRTGGRAWLVYHAYPAPHSCSSTSGSRKLLLDPITWSGGWPVIGSGTPSRSPQPGPQVP